MSGWSGFTEEEISELKNESEGRHTEIAKSAKQSKINNPQRRKHREQKIVRAKHSKKQLDSPENINNKPIMDEEHNVKCKTSQGEEIECKSNGESNDTIDPISSVSKEEIAENKSETVVTPEEKIGVLSDDKVAEMEMSSLEKLQVQQKLIEDQNKKKKVLLAEALAEKFKQTQNESQKLKAIQKQLSHLDQMLQADVEMLRNKIDEACLEFSNAQRRYESAEKEYVASKLDYFNKKELKEELTEHLYTIIQKNELRKAKKLEELMQKLNSGSDSVPSSPVNSGALPQLPNPDNSAGDVKNSQATTGNKN